MRKASYLSCATLGVLAASLFPGPAAAVGPLAFDPPPAEKFVIEIVTVNGSGCPPGTVEVTTLPGNFAFAVTYSHYTARVGVGAAATDFRKNCQLNLKMLVPQGYSYAITKTEHEGSASLSAGASGAKRTNYYYKGQSSTGYTHHPFAGPLDGAWQTTYVPEMSLIWSPCGALRNLNINTELRVAAGTSDTGTTTSSMTTTSALYHLSWDRRCV